MAGAVMISFSAVFVKLTAVPPTTSAFYRVLIGGLVLAGVVMARGQTLTPTRKALAALVAAGLFFALDLWLWHRSILYVGPGLSTLLANFQVFVLAGVGILLLQEHWSWRLLVAIPLALIGLALIVGPEWNALGEDYRLGVIFGLLTAVCYAGYLLSLRRARRVASRTSPAADVAVVSLLTAIFLAISAQLTGESLSIPTLYDGAVLSGYAIVAQVLGWVLISGSLARVPASLAGLVLLLQPTLAYVWDVTFFDRAISATEVVGAALALGAIYLGSRPTTSRRRG